jgi:hypothetical protein
MQQLNLKPTHALHRLDFGSLTGSKWTSAGTNKDIPVLVRAGALGTSANGSTFLVIDATVGTEQKFKDFVTMADARTNFESDLPAASNENVAVGIKKSFIGRASLDLGSSGFLGVSFADTSLAGGHV